MSLQRFSLGDTSSPNYKTEIKKYTQKEYMLTISNSSSTFTIYAINSFKRFLIGFNDGKSAKGYITTSSCCITNLDRSILECFIPEEDDIDEYLTLFSSILISSLFYEAICRTGAPLSFLTDNIDVVNKFISLCFKQWEIPSYYKPQFYTLPEVKCTSKEFNYYSDCKLRGDDVFALIGFGNSRVLLQTDNSHIYFVEIPEVFCEVDESEGIPRLLRYAFMWMLLVSKGFVIGSGYNIRNNNEELKKDMKPSDWNTINRYNQWLQYPPSIQKALEAVYWDGTEERVSAVAFSLS